MQLAHTGSGVPIRILPEFPAQTLDALDERCAAFDWWKQLCDKSEFREWNAIRRLALELAKTYGDAQVLLVLNSHIPYSFELLDRFDLAVWRAMQKRGQL